MKAYRLICCLLVLALLASAVFAAECRIKGNRDQTCTITGYRGDESVLVIPSNIQGYLVTAIGERAFSWSENLTTVHIPKSITSIDGSAFLGCSSLQKFLVDPKNPAFTQEQGILFNKTRTLIHTYPEAKADATYTIPEGMETIGDYAFSRCNNLTEIILPSGIKTIGEGAFYTCKALTDIHLPDSVTAIGEHAFSDCTALKSIIIPEKIRSIEHFTFAECTSLTTIILSGNLTSIGDWAFYECNTLTCITLPDSVTSIGEAAFYACTSLKEINIPVHTTSIGPIAFAY